MASHTTNTFLAIITCLSLFIATPSFANVKLMGELFKQGRYQDVLTTFSKTPRKPMLLKNPQVVLMLAVSSEKLNAHKHAYHLYMRLMAIRHYRYYFMIRDKIEKGDFIEVDEIPNQVKLQYWKIYTSIGKHILTVEKIDDLIDKDFENLKKYSVILTELEFRDDQVGKLDSIVDKHLHTLRLNRYQLVKRIYSDIISWQREVSLISPFDNLSLVLTNQGVCMGGSLSYENYFRSFFVDGCFVYGSGTISNISTPAYEQSGVGVYGAKIALGTSIFVSEGKAEVGFKLPLFYNIQKLDNPDSALYTLDTGSDLSLLLSLYSRWPIDNWFLHTEFSKFTDQDSIMWSFGIGIKL